ncbi:hypothetical protein Bbelb_324420 [Branchiostoma belcheri]|nr:hypothetical protein Bbelb_324420 [Branchiostoma belcheri]
MESDIAAGAEGGEHALGMKASGIEAHTRYVPLSFVGTTTVEMEAHLDPSPVLQKGKPTEQPAAAALTRSMYWNPYCKRLETGWYMGRWKSDERRCLYHLQTSTAVSLIAGDDVGTFGIRWTTDSEPMVLDIDNVDFCVDHNAIVTNGSLDNPDLEATIGEKLRVVLTGRKLPAEELKFEPARIYNDTETSQLVAIVGSPEHSNAENIKHVLVAEVTDSGDIAAADISKITKAKKEHLVRVNGRCCNEEKLLADIRRIYFPSFATGSQQPLLQPKMRDWVNMTSPAGDLCLGNLLQDFYKEQKNEQRTNESDGKSSSSTFHTTTSNERNQMEQQLPGSQQENENSKKLSDIQEENKKLQQVLHNKENKIEKLDRQLIESQENVQILKEKLLESEQMTGLNFELWGESQQETREVTEQLEDSRKENQTLTQQLSDSSKEKQTLKQQLSDSSKEKQALKQQLSDSSKEKQALKQQLSDSSKEKQALKQQLSDSSKEKQALKQQLSDSSKEKQALKQQLSDSSKEKQALKQQLSDSSKEKQALQQQLSDSSKEKQTLKQQMQTLNHQLLNQEGQMQSLQDHLSTTEALCSYQHHLDDVLFPPGEPDPQHMYPTSYEIQFLLLNWFLSVARPVQRLIVRCFKHYQDWSSLFHEKNCFVCRFFQQGQDDEPN